MPVKKLIHVAIGVAVVALCLYFSVYFENLTQRRAELESKIFNPEQILDRFWNEDLDRIFEEALEWTVFDRMLLENPSELLEKHGKTLGIGAAYSFVVQGEAVVGQLEEEKVNLTPFSRNRYALQSGFVFGNTVREASGVFPIDDFENTMDFNIISSEINTHIVREVIAPVVGGLSSGTRVSFYGAIDVNPKKLSVNEYDIIPLQIRILPHE